MFRTIPELAWIADSDDLSVKRYLELAGSGASWVAENEVLERLAFLCAEVSDRILHIWEWAVALDYQHQGIGRALMSEALNFAYRERLTSITLTTFRNVPWNEPLYRNMGFVTLRPDELDPRLRDILDHEMQAGLSRENRCAMRLALDNSSEA